MSEGGDSIRYNFEISEVGDSGIVNNEIARGGDGVRVTTKKVEIMLDQLSMYDPSNHKIAKVPDFLRGENAKAYDPTIVSIGPIHHGKNHIKNMENHKVWYLNQLLQRITARSLGEQGRSLEEYMIALEGLEEQARNYYSSLIQLPRKDAFLTMLLLDGVFVIELARKWSFSNMVDSHDYIFQFSKGDSNDEDNKDHCNEELVQIRRDMLMIENQLPFFILRKLFEITEMEASGNDLYLLLLKFFRRIIPGRPSVVSEEVVTRMRDVNHDHLLGLVYEAYFVDETIARIHNVEKFRFDEINSASELHEEGIKFKRFRRPEVGTELSKVKRCWNYIKCKRLKGKEVGPTTLMNVKFEKGVMKIPQLEVGDVTESLFRNLIAYELIRFNENWQQADDNRDNNTRARKLRYVTEYCFLMQFLVNSKKDVEILRRAGIVTNWLGDDEMVRLFFNKLTKNVASSQEFYYANIIRSMNTYCKKRCNRKKWWTIFLRKYINSPWSIMSVVAAIVLLLMTATNIAFGILNFKKKLH